MSSSVIVTIFNAMNEYFTTVGKNHADNIQTTSRFRFTLPPINKNTLHLHPTMRATLSIRGTYDLPTIKAKLQRRCPDLGVEDWRLYACNLGGHGDAERTSVVLFRSDNTAYPGVSVKFESRWATRNHRARTVKRGREQGSSPNG